MKETEFFHLDGVLMPTEVVELLDDTLEQAIAGLNEITSETEAQLRLGLYNPTELLNRINGQAREIRKLLEKLQPPD